MQKNLAVKSQELETKNQEANEKLKQLPLEAEEDGSSGGDARS
jgi:hypothetical protein